MRGLLPFRVLRERGQGALETCIVPQFNVNPILAGLTFNFAMSPAVVVLCCLVAAGLVVYLYQAQQKIASRKAVWADRLIAS